MVLPNFICVGVEKAGTTSIYHGLKQHPNVYLGQKKEYFFYNLNWSKGVKWYEKQFSQYKGQQCIGDITPSYYRKYENTYTRIKSILGANIKIILILRNPIYRTLSHYVHSLQYREINKDIYWFINNQKNPRFSYLFPQYSQIIKQLYESFDKEQILILIYENDISKDFNQGMKKICKFLELEDYNFQRIKANETYFPRYIYTDQEEFYWESENKKYKIPPETLVFCTGRQNLDKVWNKPQQELIYKSLLNQSQWTKYFSDKDCQMLFNQFFLKDCQELEKSLGLDISLWFEQFKNVHYKEASISKYFQI